MDHWFVSWLEEGSEYLSDAAESNRRKLESADEEDKVKKVGQSVIEQQEKTVQHLKQFVTVAKDMIQYGLEEEAITYYDAKQRVEGLPERPQKKSDKLPLFEAVRIVYRSMEKASDKETKNDFHEVWTTLRQLAFTGMEKEGLEYYIRVRNLNPELSLPELNKLIT